LELVGGFGLESLVTFPFQKNVLILGVLEEAEFYNITSLIKLVKDKIRERDSKISQVRLFSSVFLIIYCIASSGWVPFFLFNCSFPQ